MRLTVLGCSGGYAGPGQACSGYLVTGGGVTVWLDAGSGTLANLQKHVGLDQLDAIVLSHEHPDHWSDLDGFHVAYAYGLKANGMPVFSPASVQERAYAFNRPSLSWRTIYDGVEVDIGGLHLRFSQTSHPVETLAVRIDGDGRSLGYTADTGPDWSVTKLGPGIDLLLCEANWLDAEAKEIEATEGTLIHLSGRMAGQMAHDAGVSRLVLTHLWPTNDREQVRAEAEATFGGPVELAAEHAEFDV